MTTSDLDLTPGHRSDAVRDLQQRLVTAGITLDGAEPGTFDDATVEAVRRFQLARSLPSSGRCDDLTWSTLVEAGYHLGDRLLYRRTPMLRGDDVADLQHRLGALGFDAGRVDGIFGPDTEAALKDFQRNMALTTDGVLGRDTIATLLRLGERSFRPTTVAGLREEQGLGSPRPRTLRGQRIALGEPGGLAVLVAALERRLLRAGADVLTLHDPDPSTQAQEANRFDATVYVGLAPGPIDEVWFYRNRGFESAGGRTLALLLAEQATVWSTTGQDGRWHPVLRETRMPAVQWNLGRKSAESARAHHLAATLEQALDAWFAEGSPEP